ncbi:hypothetical protein [Fusobacterium polymorphum]|mgnify:CR=1 FL=1|jgi:hypothetical protein|uniref:hypothetical protein n=1 Tax=Fusobacterium nucleatum subsp. polymorphum TaxID=76857 RepID=UPI003008A40C
MSKNIIISGIETNNLKNIDIELIEKGINLIIGPSGSGKSSLAYDTIAQIGQHELFLMLDNENFKVKYKVKKFENMKVTIPIKQLNFNTNIRSTIGTYFGMNKKIALIYSLVLEMNEGDFALNKEGNFCEHCHGLGITNVLDMNKVVDYNIPLKKNPIKCWNKYKDFYSEIIEKFCLEKGIDPSKTFRELNSEEKRSFLYGESLQKYSVRYKRLNGFSKRTSKFYGIMTNIPMMLKFTPSKKFYSEKTCEYCQGKKYSEEYDKYKIFNISIGEFMLMPFENLYKHVQYLQSQIKNIMVLLILDSLKKFLETAIKNSLGHLYFNRTIPSLSGGELQRLKMVQLFNTQLIDLLIVLDEPLSGLSGIERESIYKNILKISEKHTLVIIDHSDIFYNVAKKIIALGEKGGIYGGNLIDEKKYILAQQKSKPFSIENPQKLISIKIEDMIYNYQGVDIKIADNRLNLITGRSGIGKSTLLREYFPQFFDNYLYIHQKPLQGNKNSFVATLLDFFTDIIEIFSKKFNKNKKFFSNSSGDEGACKNCGGAGYIEYSNDYDTTIKVECKECDGTGFNKELKKYKINDKNIFDIWEMTIEEAEKYFSNIDKKIENVLKQASSIMLGHLKIGQSSSSLSGGENVRIKTLRSLKTSAKIIGIDEPFKGLNPTEIYQVVLFLEELRKKGKTIIVVDHTEEAFQYFSYHIKLKVENNYIKIDN